MDTNTLINDVKVRFNHNTAKDYLKDKYQSKLIIAEQGGLWKATPELISFLSVQSEFTADGMIVLVDIFGNPVRVNGSLLLKSLQDTYNTVMHQWHSEWTELESKR